MGADALITIGLTGKYCAGKNYIASLFAQRNLEVIDVDLLGHQALERSRNELIALFSRSIIASDGSIDRKALGHIVFSDRRALRTLEGTVHPHMRQLCIEQIEAYRNQGVRAIVINAALLGRMHLDVLCDNICFVQAPLVLRLARAIQRDGASIASFFHVVHAQRDITPTAITGSQEVYLVKNWGSRAFIHRQVDVFCATMGLEETSGQ